MSFSPQATFAESLVEHDNDSMITKETLDKLDVHQCTLKAHAGEVIRRVFAPDMD